MAKAASLQESALDFSLSADLSTMNTCYMVLLACGLLVFPVPRAVGEPLEKNPSADAFALEKVKSAGLQPWFVSLLQKSDTKKRDRIVGLNVLGFLEKADYSGHFNPIGLKKCKAFLKKYQKRLKQMELVYGIAPEAIASLLWVETKFGKDLGKFKTIEVYFNLLQADHPDVLKNTLSELTKRRPAGLEDDIKKAQERSVLKAEWALKELQSLEKMYSASPKKVRALKGSYSGAFGIPQFIPSSYLSWAQPKTKKRAPDLFKMEDAIQSVAFYLKSQGWGKDPVQQKEALFHYNRSEGYVNVIQKISAELSKKES